MYKNQLTISFSIFTRRSIPAFTKVLTGARFALRRQAKILNMRIQTHPLVISAKTGIQEKVEKKRLSHIKLGKNCFVSESGLDSCLRGHDNWGKRKCTYCAELTLLTFCATPPKDRNLWLF